MVEKMGSEKLPILLTEVRDRDRKRGGTVYPGEVLKNTTVEIEPGKSITIMTVVEAGERYVKSDKLFVMYTGSDNKRAVTAKMVPCEEHLVTKKYEIGSTVKTGAYNLTYFGTIEKITKNSVTVKEELGRTRRFDIYDFARKNAHFDFEHEAERNAEMMVTL